MGQALIWDATGIGPDGSFDEDYVFNDYLLEGAELAAPCAPCRTVGGQEWGTVHNGTHEDCVFGTTGDRFYVPPPKPLVYKRLNLLPVGFVSAVYVITFIGISFSCGTIVWVLRHRKHEVLIASQARACERSPGDTGRYMGDIWEVDGRLTEITARASPLNAAAMTATPTTPQAAVIEITPPPSPWHTAAVWAELLQLAKQ